MSRELFKSMTYKNGKVFTRQSSNNVSPRTYESEENPGLTKRYNELGEKNFEKWFLTNGIMQGTIVVLGSSNKTLKRLNYVANLLWEDKGFKELRDKEDIAFEKSLKAKTDVEKEIASKVYQQAISDIEKYVSSFYDKNISRYKETERSR